MKLLLMAIVVMLGLGWNGQGVAAQKKTDVSAEDVKKQAREALETSKEYTAQQKEDFQKKLRAELDRMQKEIDRLAFKANQAKKETQAELDKSVKELQKQKDAVGKKLDEMESASGKAWEDLRSGMRSAMENLEKSYKRAAARFQ